MATTMMTCTTWVPRGFAAQHPRRVKIDEEEMERIAEMAQLQLDDAKEDLEEIRQAESEEADAMETEDAGEEAEDTEDEEEGAEEGGAKIGNGTAKPAKEKEAAKPERMEEDDDDLREYNLDAYDDDDAEVRSDGEPMGMFGNVKSLAYHAPGEEDPYITMPDNASDDEREELEVLQSDNLLLVGRVEDELAHLEVYVYEDSADNLYVHHDIMLPAIPLCIEWLDIPVGTGAADKSARGNFAAIGTTSPDIEVWDLDTVDSVYPNAILGAAGAAEKPSKKKKKKKTKANASHHVGAVQALAANRAHRNLLASASADKTVKLWDLNTAACAQSYDYHSDQVCALAWHPHQDTTLLSGSYDRTVVWADMRAPQAAQPRWGVDSDVEDLRWDPHDAAIFYVSTEAGMVHCFDSRRAPAAPQASRPVWTLQAHDKAVSSFDLNPVVPGFLATGSMDKTVKLWNTQGAQGGPTMVVSRDPGVGKVFSAKFAPDGDVGFRLAVAGSKGVVTVWDTSTNRGVREAFGERLRALPKGVVREGDEREVKVADDEADESESDDSEEGEGGEGMGPDGWESEEDEE